MADREESRREFMNEVEHAIENELDGYSVDCRAASGNGYIAEVIAWRLSRDGFLASPAINRPGDHP